MEQAYFLHNRRGRHQRNIYDERTTQGNAQCFATLFRASTEPGFVDLHGIDSQV